MARRIRRRNGLTRQDRTAPKFPDLLKRNFTADRINAKWVGDMTEIPTEHGKLYLATVIDLYSRRLLGAATGLHPDAELAGQAIKMAVATRGGRAAIWRAEESERVIFHSDRGSTTGLNRWKQHLIGGCCGTTIRLDERSDRKSADALSWAPGASACAGA